MLLQTVSNHPVHILNNAGKLSPSSFLPFCSFGEEFVGTNIKEFDIPVCDIFKPKLYFDQLCYETDLQKLKENRKLEKQLKYGLTLVLDYNDEKQINLYPLTKNKFQEVKTIYHDNANSFSMFVDTISKCRLKKNDIFLTFNFLDPVKIFEEGQYNLNNLKEISVTDSFMGLDLNARKCQQNEIYEDCKTWLHIRNLRQECGCLPLSLKVSEKVKRK